MLDNLREDARQLKAIKKKPFPFDVVESLAFENGFQAVVLHRAAHFFKSRGIPVLGPFFARLSLFLTGCDIAPGAVIGPGLRISHGVGLVIGDRVRIGRRALLLQQVTLGAPSQGRITEMPAIGDDVFIGAGARVIGPVTVGDRVFIGTNAVVTVDVPSDSKVVSTAGIEVTPRRRAEGAA